MPERVRTEGPVDAINIFVLREDLRITQTHWMIARTTGDFEAAAKAERRISSLTSQLVLATGQQPTE